MRASIYSLGHEFEWPWHQRDPFNLDGDVLRHGRKVSILCPGKRRGGGPFFPTTSFGTPSPAFLGIFVAGDIRLCSILMASTSSETLLPLESLQDVRFRLQIEPTLENAKH